MASMSSAPYLDNDNARYQRCRAGLLRVLSPAERAFRSIKTVDLENIRPIHHRLSDRVRAHVLAVHALLLSRMAHAPGATLPFCSTTIIAPRLPPRDPPSSHPRSVPRLRVARPLPSAQLTACRSTASSPCSLSSPPSRATPWPWRRLRATPILLYPQPTPIQLRAFELLAVQPRL